MLAPSSDLLRAGLAIEAQPGQAGDAVLSARPHQSGDWHGHLLCHRRGAVRRRRHFPDRGLLRRHHCAVSLGRNQLRPVSGVRRGRRLLVVIAAICAGVAAAEADARPPQFPSLASRLRVALNANPLRSVQIDAASDTAAAIRWHEPATPASGAPRNAAPRPRPVSTQECPGRPGRGSDCCWAGRPHDGGNRRAERPSDVPRAIRADRQPAPGRSDQRSWSSPRNAIFKPATPQPDRAPLPAGPQPRSQIRARTVAARTRPALAATRSKFPWAGWKDILWRTYAAHQ